jgi:hypothetical protein
MKVAHEALELRHDPEEVRMRHWATDLQRPSWPANFTRRGVGGG